MNKDTICQRCLKNTHHGVHTCSPTPLVSKLEQRISELEQICRDAYEVWAGSEGFPQPTTASEAYVLQQLCLMRDEVKRGLK